VDTRGGVEKYVQEFIRKTKGRDQLVDVGVKVKAQFSLYLTKHRTLKIAARQQGAPKRWYPTTLIHGTTA
jgi:hypothetical protein